MGKWTGVIFGAVAIAVVIGLVFQVVFWNQKITPQLGLLFAFVGFIVALIFRALWRRVVSSQRNKVRESDSSS